MYDEAAGKVKLIALDLDGTLLNSDKQLSEENLKAMEKAAAEGIEIVPATGRFYKGMPETIRSLPFVHYVITINGAQVWDVREARTICAFEIPWQRAIALMERLDTLPVIYDCFQNGWGWMTRDLYDKAEEYAANKYSLQMIKELRTPVPDLKTLIQERASGVQKVQTFFRNETLRREMQIALPLEFPDMAVTTSIVNNMEFNALDANKGNALMNLAEYLGVPMECTMAFGDDANDVTMLAAAGIGVAMGNASGEAKSAADFVTDDCNFSGVAKAMQILF